MLPVYCEWCFKILMSALNFDAEKIKVTDKLSNNNRANELACTVRPLQCRESQALRASEHPLIPTINPWEALLPQFCRFGLWGWVNLFWSTRNYFSATFPPSPAAPASSSLSICCSFPSKRPQGPSYSLQSSHLSPHPSGGSWLTGVWVRCLPPRDLDNLIWNAK